MLARTICGFGFGPNNGADIFSPHLFIWIFFPSCLNFIKHRWPRRAPSAAPCAHPGPGAWSTHLKSAATKEVRTIFSSLVCLQSLADNGPPNRDNAGILTSLVKISLRNLSWLCGIWALLGSLCCGFGRGFCGNTATMSWVGLLVVEKTSCFQCLQCVYPFKRLTVNGMDSGRRSDTGAKVGFFLDSWSALSFWSRATCIDLVPDSSMRLFFFEFLNFWYFFFSCWDWWPEKLLWFWRLMKANLEFGSLCSLCSD